MGLVATGKLAALHLPLSFLVGDPRISPSNFLDREAGGSPSPFLLLDSGSTVSPSFSLVSLQRGRGGSQRVIPELGVTGTSTRISVDGFSRLRRAGWAGQGPVGRLWDQENSLVSLTPGLSQGSSIYTPPGQKQQHTSPLVWRGALCSFLPEIPINGSCSGR